MRKIVRTNNATAIAIGAAIGALEVEKARAASDETSDSVTGPPDASITDQGNTPATADDNPSDPAIDSQSADKPVENSPANDESNGDQGSLNDALSTGANAARDDVGLSSSLSRS